MNMTMSDVRVRAYMIHKDEYYKCYWLSQLDVEDDRRPDDVGVAVDVPRVAGRVLGITVGVLLISLVVSISAIDPVRALVIDDDELLLVMLVVAFSSCVLASSAALNSSSRNNRRMARTTANN